CHLVHVPGHVRKDLRDPGPRLAMPREAVGRAHDRPDLVAEEAGVAIESRQLLAIAPLQLRLVVPRIYLAGPAVHEKPDDRFRLGGEVPGARRQRIGGSWLGEQVLLIEQAGQGAEPEAAA